jgi:energy-coupling factor transporter ATP-binding protein EcfA2
LNFLANDKSGKVLIIARGQWCAFKGAVIVIRAAEFKGLRGIREGKLTDLSPLVILVGPNGSGKSTLIEGILIAASPVPIDAIIEVIRRHEAGGSGPRWLLWRAGQRGLTLITVTTSAGTTRTCRLELERGRPADETRIGVTVVDDESLRGTGAIIGLRNKYHGHNPITPIPLQDVPEVHLIEGYPSAFQRPLHELYTRAVEQGRRSEALGILSEVFPGVSNVEILTENGEPILHLVFSAYSVPASLAGDGIQSLLRLSLELAASGGGVALLEEPEVHQHPGAIRQSARAILAAVRRGIQVMLTTHSLELIDALVAESSADDLDRLSLYRVQLQDGALKSSRLPGPDIAFARTTIEDDLR